MLYRRRPHRQDGTWSQCLVSFGVRPLFEQAKNYLSSFAQFGGRQLWFAALLVLSAALLEGVGILFLVPVVDLFAGAETSGLLAYADQVFERLSITSDGAKLILILGLFLLLLVGRNLIVWRRDIKLALLSAGFVDHWRQRIFSELAKASWRSISEYRQTDIEHSLMSDVNRLGVGTTQSLQGATALVMLGVQILIALYLSWALTLLVMAFGVAIGVLLWPLVRKSRELGKEQTAKGQRLFALLGQFLAGLKLAKVQNAGPEFTSSFQSAMASLRRDIVQFQSDRALAGLIFQILAGLLACVVIVIGLFVLNTPPTILVVFLFIQTRLIGPFQLLQTGLQSFANMVPVYKNVVALEVRLGADREVAQDTAQVFEVVKAGDPLFDMKSVSFSYGDEAKGVLSSVDVSIRAGDVVALSGPSGSGKTTFFDLLVGLLAPQYGIVEVHGVPLHSGNVEAWRDTLAYTPQDPFLFDGSLRENLSWLNDQITDAEIWAVLEAVEAKEFVSSKPGKLDYRVGERGGAMSGGERQRICLARALLRNPDLLILDEATNALDATLEARLVSKLIDEKPDHMTILMITHRPAAIDRPHKKLTISDGQITMDSI